jgi:YgiT-type zinc finger domain-containing protein
MQSENKAMKPIEKCPGCGGELKSKQVKKLPRVGSNTVSKKVTAEVCLHCGERLNPENVVKVFEEIRSKLRKQEISHFSNLGQSFTVDKDWFNDAIQPILKETIHSSH